MATATGSIRASADHTAPVPIRRRIISTKSDTWSKRPRVGGLLPASLMYFCFGRPMHHCSGVDTFVSQPRLSIYKLHLYCVIIHLFRKEHRHGAGIRSH